MTAPSGIERLQLTCEHRGVGVRRPVQGGDSERVTACQETTILACEHEREPAPQTLERVGTVIGQEVQSGLMLRPRPEAMSPLLERGTQTVVVVDLAVPYQPQVPLGLVQRLLAALDVGDRQAPMPEPGVAELSPTFTVRATAHQPIEHAFPLRWVEGAVRCSDR